MTKEQALAEIQKMLPDSAQFLQAEEQSYVGCEYGCKFAAKFWLCRRDPKIIGSSNESWEDALIDVRRRLKLIALDAIETTI